MSLDDDFSTPPASDDPPSRMFVHEPGWGIHIKRGSDRAFCYVMNPGENHYHRLVDGELFLQHGEERICLACASRRGIISFEPRRLRDDAPVFLAGSIAPEGLFLAHLCAVAFVVCLPVLIAGWVAQDKLVRGLSLGAVK